MTDLYHYTCDHGNADIGRELLVRCSRDILPTDRHQYMPRDMLRFCWFTDLDTPIREALGLTSRVSRCNRIEFRYKATDTTSLARWTAVRRTVEPWVRDALEAAQGAMPAHWWVSETPVPVVPA